MSQKIFLVLKGGLGNQLFQYAAGLAILRYVPDCNLYTLPPIYNTHSGRDYRSILYAGAPVPRLPAQQITYWNQGAGNNAFRPWSPTMFAGTDCVIEGHFQYIKPILEILPRVVDSLRQNLKERMATMQSRYAIEPRNTIFVHIRRGDYLTQPTSLELHADYYIKALHHMGLHAAGTRYLVLSDDLEWCKKQDWLSACDMCCDEPDELDSLAIMALCEGGAIIANSTFSWWGAHLAIQRPVLYPVLYPASWISSMETPQMFPEHWTSIAI